MSQINKPTLAVAMIVKNEAQKLDECLKSVVGWVDEIVLLDSGSTDETQAIAKQYDAKFFVNDEWPGFGKQRQIAQTNVTADYILWLDADERVTAELQKEILAAITENKEKTLYQVNRLSVAFGKQINHSGWSPDWVVRLHRTKDTQYNDALVHESLVIPEGHKIEALQGRLTHLTIDTLPQYTLKTAKYMKAWADQREGKKQASIGGAIAHGFFRFFKMYILKKGFLDGKHGLLLALLSANTTFTRYADLWLREYNRQNRDEK